MNQIHSTIIFKVCVRDPVDNVIKYIPAVISFIEISF